MLKNNNDYNDKIIKYVKLYANPEDIKFEFSDRKKSKELTSSAKRKQSQE